MRVAKVIGTVTLSRSHPSFRSASLKVATPLSLAELQEELESGEVLPGADDLVVWDEFGAGLGDRIALSEGAEAAQPFRPADKPVDAYNAAILDHICIKPSPPESA